MQNTTKTDKTEKNVRAVKCSVHTPRLFPVIGKIHSHSLGDLFIDHRSISDLPNECLAIECLLHDEEDEVGFEKYVFQLRLGHPNFH